MQLTAGLLKVRLSSTVGMSDKLSDSSFLMVLLMDDTMAGN